MTLSAICALIEQLARARNADATGLRAQLACLNIEYRRVAQALKDAVCDGRLRDRGPPKTGLATRNWLFFPRRGRLRGSKVLSNPGFRWQERFTSKPWVVR